MTDLIPVTAFGADAPRGATYGALTLTERPDIALASLTLRRGQAAPSPLSQPLSLRLPGPGGLVQNARAGAFWTAPGQWMIEAEGKAETDFAAVVMQAAPGCSVTEQTDGWTAFDCTGAAADIDRLLERLVNLPPAATAPGRAARTVLHHMPAYLLRRDLGHLTVWGMRSMAGSLWHALDTAAARLGAARS